MGSEHICMLIRNILEEKELRGNSVVKECSRTATDGKACSTKHSRLDVILPVGYRGGLRATSKVSFFQDQIY